MSADFAATDARNRAGNLGDLQQTALDQHGEAGAFLERDGGGHGQPQD